MTVINVVFNKRNQDMSMKEFLVEIDALRNKLGDAYQKVMQLEKEIAVLKLELRTQRERVLEPESKQAIEKFFSQDSAV